jgi:hypothetical protein
MERIKVWLALSYGLVQLSLDSDEVIEIVSRTK